MFGSRISHFREGFLKNFENYPYDFPHKTHFFLLLPVDFLPVSHLQTSYSQLSLTSSLKILEIVLRVEQPIINIFDLPIKPNIGPSYCKSSSAFLKSEPIWEHGYLTVSPVCLVLFAHFFWLKYFSYCINSCYIWLFGFQTAYTKMKNSNGKVYLCK